MSGSALDRLFNSVETQKKPSRTPTLEEQLLEDDEENEALFIDGMSESSRNSLMAKVAAASKKEEPKQTIEKVIYSEHEEVDDIPESTEIEETEDVIDDNIEEDVTEELVQPEPSKQIVEDDYSLDIERPAEKPATEEEMKTLNSSQENDVADELVQPTKSKRGRKPKVKQDQSIEEEITMEKQVSTIKTPMPNVGGTIMNVLGVTMLQDLLKSNYTFREFGKEDTALIIKHLLNTLKGDN